VSASLGSVAAIVSAMRSSAGKSSGAKFAAAVTRKRGHVNDEALQNVRAAGYSDAELVEIVLHVALNTLTNYVNEVAKTDVDVPVVHARQTA
jgi:alkylhydroperoxidase family enzyme